MNTVETYSNKKHSKLFLGFFLVVTLGAALFFLARTNDAVISSSLVIPEIVKLPEKKELSMAFVGDLMMHDEQRQSGYDTATNNYNFDYFFKSIKDLFKGKDIVFGNLETPIAGEKLKYGGYPTFNAPESYLESLSKAHFTHLSLANNHSLDRRAEGLQNTISNVIGHGFIGLGAHQSPTEKPWSLFEKNGLKVGFLAYTYGTNGFTLRAENNYMLDYIDKEKIKKDISLLKLENPDLVIVSLHMGDEYKRTQNEEQTRLMQSLCDAGAHIIIGAHPHVLEPMTFLSSTRNTKCLVTYSLGNFVSGMNVVYTDLGGILEITAKKENNQIYITPNFIPTWVQQTRDKTGKETFEILKLTDTFTNLTTEQQRRITLYKTFVEKNIVQFEQNTPVLLK